MRLIKDPIHGNIELTNLEHALLQEELVNRLHFISQQSLAFFTFPSAHHKRFSHSIGVMHLSGLIFRYSLANANPEIGKNFLSQKREEIYGILKRKIPTEVFILRNYIKNYQQLERALNNVGVTLNIEFAREVKKYYLYIVNFINPNSQNRDNEESVKFLGLVYGRNFLKSWGLDSYDLEVGLIFVYFILLEVVRLTGLYHDIGHFPFSHIIEKALQDFFDVLKTEEFSKKENSKIIKCLEREMTRVKSQSPHEYIVQKIFSLSFLKATWWISKEGDGKTTQDISAKKIAIVKIFYDILEEILIPSKRKREGLSTELLSIVSSTVDSDRIDYIIRDGKSSGFLESSTDTERIIKTFKLGRNADGKKFLFAPSVQSINDVTQLLLDRYRIYKFLVNHHRVRKHDTILKILFTQFLEIEYRKSEGFKSLEEKVEIISNRIKDGCELQIKSFETLSKIESADPFTTVSETLLLFLLYSSNFADAPESIQLLYKITDGWLLYHFKRLHTILKYPTASNLGILPAESSRLEILLDELFNFKKHYKPLWKGEHDYRTSMIRSLSTWLKKTSNAEHIKKLYDKYLNSNLKIFFSKPVLLNALSDFTGFPVQYFYLQNILSVLTDEEFFKILSKSLQEKLHDPYLIVTKANYPAGFTGISQDFRILSLKDDTVLEFKNASSLPLYLKIDLLNVPQFYVYVTKDEKIDFIQVWETVFNLVLKEFSNNPRR